nr:Flp family type IVb pilin [Nitrosomonas nitrosa]
MNSHNSTRGVTNEKSLLRVTFFKPNRRNMMSKLVQSVKNFMQEEEGVTAIEYGMIAFLIAVAILAAVTAVGGRLNVVFGQILTALGG